MMRPLLQPSNRDNSNEGSQHIFSLRNKKQESHKALIRSPKERVLKVNLGSSFEQICLIPAKADID